MGHRVTEVELPPLFCPLESAVHPRVRRIEQRAEEWIHTIGMCATEREKAWTVATHSGDFFARFAAPHGCKRSREQRPAASRGAHPSGCPQSRNVTAVRPPPRSPLRLSRHLCSLFALFALFA
jgi:hypothetical protein